MSKWHGGKGSKQRPTDKEKFDKEYERIFGGKPGVMRTIAEEDMEWYKFNKSVKKACKEALKRSKDEHRKIIEENGEGDLSS